MLALAGDLLAVSVKKMLDELAGAANWPAAQKVRSALETYEAVRVGEVLKDETDSQCAQINEPAPVTQCSREVYRG